MDALFDTARRAGASTVHARYVPTDRNGMVSQFFPAFGFDIVERCDAGSITYSKEVDQYAPHTTFIDVNIAD